MLKKLKKFFSFAFECLNNENGWIIPLITALAGAYGASQSGGDQTSYQTTSNIYTPQQQGMQSLLYYLALNNLYNPQSDPNADYLNQLIYGTPSTTGQGTNTGLESLTGSDLINLYEDFQEDVTKTEAPFKQLQTDVRSELLKPVYDVAYKVFEDKGNISESKDYKDVIEGLGQKIEEIGGLNTGDGEAYIRAATYQALQDVTTENPNLRYEMQSPGQVESARTSGMGTRVYPDSWYHDQLEYLTMGKGPEWRSPWRDYTDDIRRLTTHNEEFKNEIIPRLTGETEIVATPEPTITEPAETTFTETPTETISPETTGGLLSDIAGLSENISKQFALARESGKKEISDWYEQAMREMEQRGISQSSGLMGSQFEKDVGAILGKKGELMSTLGRELDIAEAAAQNQNWYDMFGALTNLQALQANLSNQTSPYMAAAMQMASSNAGQTTSTTIPNQGVGIIPGALSGLYTGMGLYGMGQNYGWWGNNTTSTPATAYGAGSSGLNLSGTQNLWNQYSGNNLWY